MNALQHKAEYILTVTNELVQNLSIYFVQNLGEEYSGWRSSLHADASRKSRDLHICPRGMTSQSVYLFPFM